MTVVSKAAGGISAISCLYDIHKTALIYSKNAYQKKSADTYISCSLGNQKADRLSYRDAKNKNWMLKNNFFAGIRSIASGIGGYLRGFSEGIVRHAPALGLSALAIGVSESKKAPSKTALKWLNKNAKNIANGSAIALAIYTVYDFMRNSTGLFQKTDYLK